MILLFINRQQIDEIKPGIRKVCNKHDKYEREMQLEGYSGRTESTITKFLAPQKNCKYLRQLRDNQLLKKVQVYAASVSHGATPTE